MQSISYLLDGFLDFVLVGELRNYTVSFASEQNQTYSGFKLMQYSLSKANTDSQQSWPQKFSPANLLWRTLLVSLHFSWNLFP